jgi:hypothetical protein
VPYSPERNHVVGSDFSRTLPLSTATQRSETQLAAATSTWFAGARGGLGGSALATVVDLACTGFREQLRPPQSRALDCRQEQDHHGVPGLHRTRTQTRNVLGSTPHSSRRHGILIARTELPHFSLFRWEIGLLSNTSSNKIGSTNRPARRTRPVGCSPVTSQIQLALSLLDDPVTGASINHIGQSLCDRDWTRRPHRTSTGSYACGGGHRSGRICARIGGYATIRGR